jgi:hypothetical protein
VSDQTETLLRARVAELEAALKPFAGYAKVCNENCHGDHIRIGYYYAESPTVGDCRRAASVLSSGADHANPKEATS